MRSLVYLLTWLLTADLWAAVFVNSEEEFFMHMKNHVQNVRTLADSLLAMAEKDPDMRTTLGLAPGQPLTPELKKIAREFLSIHDASKIDTSKEFMARYRINEPQIKVLYQVYGKTFVNMTDAEKSVISKVINGTDAMERERFLSKKNLSKDQIKFLDQVEKLADGVERGSNPVTSEEMAKKVLTMTQMQEMELGKAKTPDESELIKKKIEISKKLERLYPAVTVKLEDFKVRAANFKKALESAGIMTDYLDKYSLYQIMSDFEESKGAATPTPSALKKYFFENPLQMKKLQSMLKTAVTSEGLMMLDFVKIEHAKQSGIPYNSRFTKLYETLAGECEN